MSEPQAVESTRTTEDMAELLHVSLRYVRTRCHSGEWPALRQPWKGQHRYLFTPEHVELILASMDPQPVVEMRRPRKAAAPARRKGRSS